MYPDAFASKFAVRKVLCKISRNIQKNTCYYVPSEERCRFVQANFLGILVKFFKTTIL